MNQSTILLSVRGLTKHYAVRKGPMSSARERVRAVDGVSFDIREGETLGLVGESGCGKTTTARLVVKAIEPTAGEILLRQDGRMVDITKLSRHEIRAFRRQVQMIYQDPYSSLNPRMTILDVVGEPLVAMKLARRKEVVARVRELLPRVDLDVRYMNRYPHAFSGGQRQRINIARALAPEPRLIVADEPVSALDVSVQAQILNLLLDLQQEFGLTYLMISHNLDVVKHVSDRIAVMYVGKIVELSQTKVMFQSPLHPYTVALLSAIPRPDPRARGGTASFLRGDIADPANVPPGCRFHPRCRWSLPVCSEREPTLRELGGPDSGGSHLVACHRAEELDLKGTGRAVDRRS